jgi:hypothetical protein
MVKSLFILTITLVLSTASFALAQNDDRNPPSTTSNDMMRGSANPVDNEIGGSMALYPPDDHPGKAPHAAPEKNIKKKPAKKHHKKPESSPEDSQ